VNFALPRRDNVDLAVFDLGGRRVHTLAKGSFAPGSYNMKWDGSTDSGHPAGPGMYFYRLKVGDQTFNIRGVHLQ
jgi:flagellar hook assembly protein FlgD